MTQAAKKTHNRSQAEIDFMWERRNIRWSWWIKGIIWSVLFLFFLLAFILHNLQAGGLPAVVTMLLPSSPPITIVARDDLPAFTILTREKIAIVQGDQERNPSSRDSSAVKEQEEAFYQRITLRLYSRGEKIQLSDLGPRLPATHNYQIREIKANASLNWIQVGDTLAFTLINTACSSEATASKTNSTCVHQPNALSLLLKNVVVIQVGKASQDDLIALLVAIPLEENSDSVAFLNVGGRLIVAYPVATITSISTTEWSLIT
jgi:hypothetical protein